MAGKEEKLKAYQLAKELGVQTSHIVSSTEGIPQSLAYTIVSLPVGMMADMIVASNTKYRNRKVNYLVKSSFKVARMIAAADLMHESGWLSDEEYEPMQTELENLSKMIWGLVKNIRRSMNRVEEVAVKGNDKKEQKSEKKVKEKGNSK